MSSFVRVEPHPRGHIAFCNGNISVLGAKVEQCYDEPLGNASLSAAQIEAVERRERERKAQKLKHFQRRVKQRVHNREKVIRQEMAVKSTETVQSEQRAAEQAVKLDRTKVWLSVDAGQDIEDVRVVASGRDSRVPQMHGNHSASQVARRSLLQQKEASCKNDIQASVGDPKLCAASSQKYFTKYQTIDHVSKEGKSVSFDDIGYEQANTSFTSSSTSEPQKTKFKERPSPKTMLRKFTAQGQIEHEQKKQAGIQYLLFRRIYSDLEREQAKKKQLQRTHTQQVENMKKRKESDRRIVEEEVNAMDSFSTVSTEATEDRERAAEWAELMLLEERKQMLQKTREMDRYIQALKALLKKQLEDKQVCVPPICSCGTIWDTNPDTCANNCAFYRNPKAYAKALSNVLQSARALDSSNNHS